MKFGIIGGNGVAATNRLLDLVECKVTKHGAIRDQHHPEMIVWQATQEPSRSMYLEGRGPSWIPGYVRIAQSLKTLGCDVACMCCNTAHYAIDEVQEKSGLTFINLLDEVCQKAKKSGEKKFELFVTDGARKFRIYDKAFSRLFPDAELTYPDVTRQAEVTRVIAGVKTAARFGADNEIRRLIGRLVETATAPVILGCTDIRVAFDRNEAVEGVSNCLIDSLETLADAIVAHWLGEKE